MRLPNLNSVVSNTSFITFLNNVVSFYVSDVDVLNREDFMRLNHELCFWPPDEVDFDENAAERIWANDDPMSSIDLEFESSFQQDISPQNGQSSQHGAQGYSDQHENASQHSQHHPSTHSGTQGYISIAESSMSTDSMTLSVKTLNKLNLLVITEDDVVQTQQWSDAFYFTKQVNIHLHNSTHFMFLICSQFIKNSEFDYFFL